MKIAIPSRNQQVDDHFGHCEYYTIYSVSDTKTIVNEELFQAPQGCGCKSDIATVLQEKGVKVMLAGNMGQGAVNKVSQAGIQVFRGCTGPVRLLAEAYLRDLVKDSGETCSHHGDDHQCSH